MHTENRVIGLTKDVEHPVTGAIVPFFAVSNIDADYIKGTVSVVFGGYASKEAFQSGKKSFLDVQMEMGLTIGIDLQQCAYHSAPGITTVFAEAKLEYERDEVEEPPAPPAATALPSDPAEVIVPKRAGPKPADRKASPLKGRKVGHAPSE